MTRSAAFCSTRSVRLARRANSSASSRFLASRWTMARISGAELGTAAVDPAIGHGGQEAAQDVDGRHVAALHRVLPEAQLRLRERLITHLGLAVIDSSALAGGHFVDLLRGVRIGGSLREPIAGRLTNASLLIRVPVHRSQPEQ
jgi:hypothetical protein